MFKVISTIGHHSTIILLTTDNNIYLAILILLAINAAVNIFCSTQVVISNSHTYSNYNNSYFGIEIITDMQIILIFQ